MKPHTKLAGALLLLLFCTAGKAQRWQLPPNGQRLTYSNNQVKLLVTHLAAARTYNSKRYYENGRLLADENWRDSLRHGLCKYYGADGTLTKEIRFQNNYITEYTSYRNGSIYTRISADRSEVINKGRRLRLPFDRYYEIDYTGYMTVWSRKTVIDFLSNMMIPEKITQLMEDKFETAMKGLPEGSDLLGCAGRTSRFDGGNVDLASFNAAPAPGRGASSIAGFGGRPGKGASSMEQVGGLINRALSDCSGGGGGAPSGSLTPKYSKEQSQARQTMQTMIARCNEQTSTDRKNEMIGVKPPSDKVIAERVLPGVATAFRSSTAVAQMAATKLGAGAAEAQMATILAENGFTATAAGAQGVGAEIAAVAASPAVQVVGAFALGYSIGTLINNLGLGELIQSSAWMANATTSEHEREQEKMAAEMKAKRDAQEAAAKKAAESQTPAPAGGTTPAPGTTSPSTTPPASTTTPAPAAGNPPPGTPTVSTPSPEATDPCAAMQRFFDRCERSGWRDFKCTEFARLVNGCKGDIRVVNPTPDGGDIAAFGCASEGDAATARALDCKKKGMIMITQPGGAGGCAQGQPVLNKDRIPGRNDGIIDPVRGDGLTAAFSGRMVARLNAGGLQAKLAAPQELVVVFVDPHCPSCATHLQALAGASGGLAGKEVAIVDVTDNPALADEYGVTVVPTTFRSAGGKLTKKAEGSMPAATLQTYLRQ